MSKTPKISQQDIADLVGETRPNVKKWMSDPELIPVGVYKKLQTLGIDIKTQEWKKKPCELCSGSGFRLERITDE